MIGGLRLIGYLRSRQLWLSIGLHAGWNFSLSAFGYQISGSTAHGVIAHTAQEPDWLSGGAFGPEKSILILPIILLAAAALQWWTEDGQEPAKEAEAAPTSAP